MATIPIIPYSDKNSSRGLSNRCTWCFLSEPLLSIVYPILCINHGTKEINQKSDYPVNNKNNGQT